VIVDAAGDGSQQARLSAAHATNGGPVGHDGDEPDDGAHCPYGRPGGERWLADSADPAGGGAMALTILLSVARRANTDLEILRAMARRERAKPNAARAI
jgi:hypothetical protein